MAEKVENILRREIEFMFGRRIVSSRDCILLSEEIFRITKARLNSNTLRRFFGLVKTNYSPSGSTLHILSTYCGFSSFEDIKNHKKELAGTEISTPEQKYLLNFLVNIFHETPVESERSKTFGSIVKQTILFLNQNHDLMETFQSAIAKTKNGQNYYFEANVQIDRLNSFFGNGLRYYLKEKIDPEAQIFGHSLLLFRDWLTENQPSMDRRFQEMTTAGYHSSFLYNTSGRYFASLLYHADARGYAPTETLISIHTYDSNMEGTDIATQVEFELIIAEALILTFNAEEGWHFADLALKKLLSMQEPDESIVQNLYLLQVLALHTMGDSYAEVLYQRIRPTSFNFLNKKLQTILYSFLTQQYRKSAEGIENQSDVLIKETGFLRLKRILNFARSPVSID